MIGFKRYLNGMKRCGVALLLAAAATSTVEAAWPAIADPPTHAYHPGRWVWAELFTEDVATAKRFYGDLFGWRFESYQAGELDYALAKSGEDAVGGLVQRQHKYVKAKGSRWVGLVSVPDVDAAAAYAESHGGKVTVPPIELPGRGKAALLADPEGATFGVIHADSGDPEDYLGDQNQWIWIELWSKEPAKMAEFYAGLAGYETDPVEMASGGEAFELSSGGYLRCRIILSPAPDQTSAWIPYLRVNDVEAVAKGVAAAGGKVLAAPSPELGDGNVAFAVDPTGAALALVQRADETEEEQP